MFLAPTTGHPQRSNYERARWDLIAGMSKFALSKFANWLKLTYSLWFISFSDKHVDYVVEERIITYAHSSWDQNIPKAMKIYKSILENLHSYVTKETIEKSRAVDFLEPLNELSDILLVAQEPDFKKDPTYSRLIVYQLLGLREKFSEMKMDLLEDLLLFVAYYLQYRTETE